MAEDIKISLQTTTPEIKVQSNTKATTSNIKNSQANIGIVTIGQTGATGVKGETGPAGSITAEQEAAIAANTAKTSYPSADSTKLAGISAGAEINVKSDWNATSGDAEILNKPTIPTDTNTTYSVSCVDGENSDEEKIRLTDSSGSTDDVILEAGTGLSIARSGDKITFTNTVVDTDTVLTTEQVQDIVGAMFTSNTETRMSATYDDNDGTIDLVVDDMTADTNTQLTTEQVQDIIGAMVDGGTETNIAVTYDDTSGKLNFISTDTNTTYSEATGSSNGLMSSTHYSKLEEIEIDADVTDTANVTAAGALMDSELTDLAGVKGVTISTLQVKPSEGAFVNGDKTKLDGIEAGATADQTQADINSLNVTAASCSGNAATATTAQGITGATDGDVTITSDGNVTVKLDADDDESAQKFKVTDNSDATVFHVTELGAVLLAGDTITNTGSGNDLTIQSDGNMTFTLDRDNDETNQSFAFKNFNVEIANLDESGNLQIDGDITIDGNNISNNATAANFNIASSRILELQHAGVYNIQMGNSTNADVLKVEGDSEVVTVNGALTVSGNITAKQREIYSQSFLDDLGTTKHYLPWKDINEQTTIYQEEAAMLMPCDGRIVSVTVKVMSITGNGDMTIGVNTIAPNINAFGSANWTEEETETLSIASTDDYHVFHFAFDNAKHFDSGDLVSLSIQNDADLSSNTYWYVSTVVEYDWSTFLGTTSAEHDSNP